MTDALTRPGTVDTDRPRRHLPMFPGADACITLDREGRGAVVQLGAVTMTLPYARKRTPHRFDPFVERALIGSRGPVFDDAEPEVSRDAIDCESRLPLCKGACCRRSFFLSREEVNAGVVRWDFRRPHQIARTAEGRCVHHESSGRCAIHADRPNACKRYDCRHDANIWIDFESRVPRAGL